MRKVVALLPYYAGLRIGEVVGLDVDDIAISAVGHAAPPLVGRIFRRQSPRPLPDRVS
jgi:integrase